MGLSEMMGMAHRFFGHNEDGKKWMLHKEEVINGMEYVYLQRKGKVSKPIPKKIYAYVMDCLSPEMQQEAFAWLTMAYKHIDSRLGVSMMFGFASNLLSLVPEGGMLDEAMADPNKYIDATLEYFRKIRNENYKGKKLDEWIQIFKPLVYAYLEEAWVLDFLSHQREDIYRRFKENPEYFSFLVLLLEAIRVEIGLDDKYKIRPSEVFRLQKSGLTTQEIAEHGALFGYSAEEIMKAKEELKGKR